MTNYISGRFWNRTEPNHRNRTARNRTAMNRTEPLQRTARNHPVNRTVPSTCSVFPCITGGTRASTGFQHFQAPNVPKPVLPRVRGPAPPAYCFSEEATPYKDSTCFVFPCIAAGARGSTGFPHFQVPNVPKLVLPRVRGPAPPTLLIASPKKQRM